MNAVEFNLQANNSPTGIGLGEPVAPLTSRGRELVNLIHAEENQLVPLHRDYDSLSEGSG
jgi:hypothetical protein